MLILTTKEFDIENLTLTNPEKIDGKLISNVNVGDDALHFQTPKMLFERHDESSLDLILDSENVDVKSFYANVRSIENRVCDLISQNSQKWFSSELSREVVINNLFRSSFKIPDTLDQVQKMNVLHEDVEVFDTSKRERKFEDMFLDNVVSCTFLLIAKNVTITSNSASIVWDIVQVLIHRKKSKVKGFGIKMDTEDVEKLDVNVGIRTEEAVEEKSDESEQTSE